MKILQIINGKLFILFFVTSCAPTYTGSQQQGFIGLVPIIVLVVVVLLFISIRKSSEADPLTADNGAEFSNGANMVLKVNLKGGLIGFLLDNPRKTLQEKLLVANRNGWKVIQVIPDTTGNLFVYIFRLILLIVTLSLYTQANGYLIILEKKQIPNKE
ncbi:MAG: hypothetical protein H6695_02420 [Deferribacteres bacterium]|nr:hypothetical protein [candidate division KSB1 bacterium]MCB9509001.1 hypothetical protein [Deferribacteres bacterium]